MPREGQQFVHQLAGVTGGVEDHAEMALAAVVEAVGGIFLQQLDEATDVPQGGAGRRETE